MPEIARFYGIVIKLFFGDHPPPHFHAVYGEYVGLFDINTLEVNIQSPPLFDTLTPAFSRRAKEILRGSLNIYIAGTCLRSKAC